ncbi:MAG TPA: ABC transporter permease [Acidimicrobiia bacterium]|nr:ABC transporter permease [Acidimicrobiia bacterium]
MTTLAPLRRRWDWFNGLLRTWAVLVYIFLFTPILVVVIYSFNRGRFLLTWDGFGTNWYGAALQNEGIQRALATSVRVAAVNAVVAVVLGTMAGIALARRSGKWSRPFLILVFLILVAPEIVDAISYLIFFVRINLGWSFARLVIGHSIFNSAVVTLIVLARLQGLDESLEEAAADLGATPWRAFRQITLPLMLPAVLAGGLLSFTFSLDDVIISSFVSTSGGTTLPVYVFSALRTGLRGDLAAISTVTLAATLVALGVMVFALRRSGESVEGVVGTITGAG